MLIDLEYVEVMNKVHRVAINPSLVSSVFSRNEQEQIIEMSNGTKYTVRTRYDSVIKLLNGDKQ